MAKMLLKAVPKCRVDIFDSHPHPYGLIRNGVCPDKPSRKGIESDFKTVFTHNKGRCEFIGNTYVGKDIDLSSLRDLYSATILATGASHGKSIRGVENDHKMLTAKKVVNWYCSSLDNQM